MRHPTTGLSEDDLSRLTGSSSSSATAGSENINNNNNNNNSSPSSSSSSTPTNTSIKCIEAELFEKINNESLDSCQLNTSLTIENKPLFKSTYLPEIINPLDWQKSRKRKERLDSTSSTGQDPKLQRSNSEELVLTTAANINILPKFEALTAIDGNTNVNRANTDAIRRVSSEDFKKTSTYAAYLEQEICNIETKAEDDCKDETSADHTASDVGRRSRYETSPARSQRFSPIRAANGNNNNNSNNQNNNNNVGLSGKYRDSDDSECEHERRRSSERFCKVRATHGRKSAGVTKKSNSSSGGGSKYLPTRLSDENAYKYDLSSLKYERRGFISKKVGANLNSDLNDNNLIDFHQQQEQGQGQIKKTAISPTSSSAGSEDSTTVLAPRPPKRSINIPVMSTPQESLPWDRSVPEDQTPILSRRYATVRQHGDNMDTAAKLSKIMPYPQHTSKQSVTQLLNNDVEDCMETTEAFRVFTSLENLRTREVMQQVLPAIMSFQSPEERLKQINKRLTAMKKKLVQLEEQYEARNGYRPSPADRLNDKYMKNIMSELNKLRKERHELKSDPMAALGLKVRGGIDAEKKLEEMRKTITEIEQSLTDKRKAVQRPMCLEELTADQLVQEKTAVQHGLLYLESLYGRPTTKDERDAARPLYERYRQLKRMVSRSVLLSNASGCGTDLPTILEHEAMSFEHTPQQYSSNNSSETTNSPTASAAQDDSDNKSTSDKTLAGTEANENIADMTIDQLWEYLERTREEKKVLKSSIREYETVFEQEYGRKMLKNDRRNIEETYAQYKEKKAKARLLQALIKKQISR